jgi:hypothetical protein
MAILYICDRCGNQTGRDELRTAEFSLPPDPDIALDLCPDCAGAVRSFLVPDDRPVIGTPAHFS